MTTDSSPNLTPIQKLGEAVADRVERWMPNPFVFAILLTYTAALAAFISEGASPPSIAFAWYDGIWGLLQFAMQMVLILVTATVIAHHPSVKALIDRLVSMPKNGKQAAVLVGIVSMLTGWISWGLGLIVGAIVAREMGVMAKKNGVVVHYPLLAVAGYMGMSLTWGWGLSNSAGLLQATPGNIFMEMGIVDRLVESTEWVFHSYPLILTALALVYASVMLWLLSPPDQNSKGIEHYVDIDTEEAAEEAAEAAIEEKSHITRSFADRVDNSRILGGIIALTGVIITLHAFYVDGLGALNLNVFNFGFLMIGMLLFLSPSHYQAEFYRAIHGSAGVILQFPFYAGIIGIMTGTGLVDTMTAGLLSIATPENFPVVAWVTAGVLNLFVPSAGGEWAIIGGPILMAAQELNIPLGQAIVAYSAGDSHTNLLNPFWAIPLLAITGLRAREMFGYAITMMVLLIPFMWLALYFLPY